MRITIICVVICAMWAVTNSNIAEAKRTKTKAKSAISQKLQSDQQEDVSQAIRQIKKGKRPADVRALTNRIRDGLPPKLLPVAIDALVAIKGNLATKTLIALSTHRSQAVRKKVAMSLPNLRSPQMMKVLVKMLDDPDAEVRSQAAVAIGKLRPALVMNNLITAAERGVFEASEVVGKTVRLKKVPSLIKMLDDKNTYALSPMFRELALRKDIPTRHKIAIVDRLTELSTPESKRLLITLASKLPKLNVARLAAANALIKELEKEAKNKDKKVLDTDPKKNEKGTPKNTEEKEKR